VQQVGEPREEAALVANTVADPPRASAVRWERGSQLGMQRPARVSQRGLQRPAAAQDGMVGARPSGGGGGQHGGAWPYPADPGPGRLDPPVRWPDPGLGRPDPTAGSNSDAADLASADDSGGVADRLAGPMDGLARACPLFF